MRVYLFSIVFCFFFLSCDKKTAVEKAVEEIPMVIKVERFDKVFFESKPEDLQKIKKQFMQSVQVFYLSQIGLMIKKC